MSRYIDADDLLKYKTDHQMISTHLIYNAETADVVEVVRCKDCKYYNPTDHCYLQGAGENDYCSYGERAEA